MFNDGLYIFMENAVHANMMRFLLIDRLEVKLTSLMNKDTNK